MTVPQQATAEGRRKRRSHKKSRYGCRNCKLRSVKCDETRPMCQKCTAFGVACNYDTKTPDLQSSFVGTAPIMTVENWSGPRNETAIRNIEVLPSLWYPLVIADSDAAFELDSQSLGRLSRFHSRTVLSIGTKRTADLFQSLAINLACAHPFLMHIVQTLTATHDRYLATPTNTRQTVAEVYHLSRAAALFNQKLSRPIQPGDRDGLWATALLIGTAAFSWIDATMPEEAWPLRPAQDSDLEWLRLSDSKAVIWKLTDPLRPDGAFSSMRESHHVDLYGDDKDEDSSDSNDSCAARAHWAVPGVPMAPALARLCDLDATSTPRSSPYYAAVRALLPLLAVECNQASIVRFFVFINRMQPAFKRLLERKDPRALLLLAYWFAKVCRAVWWLEWRAIMECRSTCLYLERFHAADPDLLVLLAWPKMRCGLLGEERLELVELVAQM